MNRIAVILPAYNEEQTISTTMEDYHQALPDAAIWVINNRSNDGTEQTALATLIRIGCGGSVRTMYKFPSRSVVPRRHH